MYLCTKFQGDPSKNLNFKMRGWKKKHYFKHNQQIHGMCWIHAGSKEGTETSCLPYLAVQRSSEHRDQILLKCGESYKYFVWKNKIDLCYRVYIELIRKKGGAASERTQANPRPPTNEPEASSRVCPRQEHAG